MMEVFSQSGYVILKILLQKKRDGLSSYRESNGIPARKVGARLPRPLNLIIVAFAQQLTSCQTFRVLSGPQNIFHQFLCRDVTGRCQ